MEANFSVDGEETVFFFSQDSEIPYQVRSSLISECLVLYPGDHIHLRNFKYRGGELTASVLPHNIDYSTITVDYYTASQILMVASQLSYVLGGCIFFDSRFKYPSSDLYPTYIELLNSGQLYYVRMNMKFKKKIWNSRPQKVSMHVKKLFYKNGICLMYSTMNFGNSNAQVDVTLLMNSKRFIQ